MKAFAVFMIILCLIVTGGIIFLLATSNLNAVSESCNILPLEKNTELFDLIKSQLEDGTFTGTRFSNENLTSANQYRVYTWTVRVENRTALPAHVTEIRVLPLKGYDILQFDMNAVATGNSPGEQIIQPHSSALLTVSVLTSGTVVNASSRDDVRDATISWYFAGYPFPETNGKGGKLILRP